MYEEIAMKMLRKLRKDRGLIQPDMAELLGISYQAYGNYENGKREPDNATLVKLAEYFGVTVDYLLRNDEDVQETIESSDEPKPSQPGSKWIPVLGHVAAGIPIEAIEDIIDYEEISEDMSRQGDYFALQIKGDSMEPRISSGDVVIVQKQAQIDSGQIGIVIVNGHEATCKKIMYTESGMMLISLNPIYDPTFYAAEQIVNLPVVIIGKVVELRAKFR